MTDFDRLDRLRGYFHTGETPIAKPDCLDEHTVAALADGTLDPETRSRALAHLATCALCRRAVASVAEALADGPITHEIEIVEGRRGRHGTAWRITVPLAAAATLLLLLWSPAGERPQHRGGDERQGPVPLRPIGTVAAAPDFNWTRVRGSDLYRVTLFTAGAVVVYEAQVADTSVALPDSVRLEAERPYLWKVQARTGWDRWTQSELVEFTIARGPPK